MHVRIFQYKPFKQYKILVDGKGFSLVLWQLRSNCHSSASFAILSNSLLGDK